MRAIMVMYDSLRRDLLPCYAPDTPLDMPNFKRLAERAVTFDSSYVCSMPCMPARRELHTGRANFLHRSWGPVEPFDDSMPQLLRQAGVHTHLATDHYHYVQDGGATYQGRYSTWSCYRGQESDEWVGNCAPRPTALSPHILINENVHPLMAKMRERGGWQNDDNRQRARLESEYPQAQTFADGLDFITRNAPYDNWFVQIETFDPHEPFTSPTRYHNKWFDPDQPGYTPDWPPYAKVAESAQDVENMRKKYYALAEFCDHCLGLVLDKMDELDLWKDTMLIVNTDHGFFLGEHDWWGKGSMPDWEELTHTPLFIWDPRSGAQGVRSSALVQTIDLAPTLLDFFGLPIPADMRGKPLGQVMAQGLPVREYAMFGYHGGPINITDGRYVYMRAVQNAQVGMNEYTLMPTHMRGLFSPEELAGAQLAGPLPFTKGCPVLKVPAQGAMMRMAAKLKEDLLYDLQADPAQTAPIQDEAVKARMLAALAALLAQNDAPEEVYARYALQKA